MVVPTCAFQWEEGARIYLRKGGKGDPSKISQDVIPKRICKGRRKDRVARGNQKGADTIPCREDLAKAAISWIVRALRDLGSIATVSPTFTLGNGTRGSVLL